MKQLVFFFLLLIPFTSLATPLVGAGQNCTFAWGHDTPYVVQGDKAGKAVEEITCG